MSAHHDASTPWRWQPVALTGMWGAFLWVAFEWLFFVTKLSFLSPETTFTRIVVLVAAPLPLVLCAVVLARVARVVADAAPTVRVVARTVAVAPAVVYLAALFLLLFDNFTNVVLGFSIQKTAPPWSWSYVLLVAACLFLGWRSARGVAAFLQRSASPWFGRLGLALVLLSVAASAIGLARGRTGAMDEVFSALGAPARRPNILLFGSDGVDARRTSAYGYARRTTPHLEKLAASSLFCENAFANSSHTTGSLISILTGRSPLATRVVFPPDILTGEDAFRHFPGLLRHWGYTNLHVSIRHFADAYDLNLRDGFDISTFQRPSRLRLDAVVGEQASFFLRTMLTRIRDRVLHIFGAGQGPAAILEVQQPTEADGLWARPQSTAHADSARVEALVDFIRETQEPWFAHGHLMASHGPKFPIARPVFSPGGRQTKEWLPDYYDDAILQFDTALGRVLQVLREQGQLSNTIVVAYSDHGMRGSVRQRTPLLFAFPEAEHAGRIVRNVQNLDIVPTLVDYLGVEPPAWMSGRSLLRDEKTRTTPRSAIFAASCAYEAWIQDEDRVWVDPEQVGPPFYSLRYVTLVSCSRAYTVDLTEKRIQYENVPGHTRPCEEGALPHPQTVFRTVVEQLRANDYDVSSFGAEGDEPSVR